MGKAKQQSAIFRFRSVVFSVNVLPKFNFFLTVFCKISRNRFFGFTATIRLYDSKMA